MDDSFYLNVDTSTFDNSCLILDDLHENMTVRHLKRRIHDATGIPLESIHVWYGFYLQPTQSDDMTLRNLNLRSGDTICIEDSAKEFIVTDADQPFWESGIVKYYECDRNNSSLFQSMHFLIFNGSHSMNQGYYLRKSLEKMVRKYRGRYAPLISRVGLSIREFCAQVSNPDYTGGKLEFTILSDFFQIEIVVFDVRSTRVTYYPDRNSSREFRVFLLQEGPYYVPVFMVVKSGVRMGMFTKSNEVVYDSVTSMVRDVRRHCEQNSDYRL